MTQKFHLTVPSGSRGAGITALVLGGFGSRLGFPIDRIDELTLAADIAGTTACQDRLELEGTVLDGRLRLRVGPLEDGALADDARRRVLERLVDRVASVRRAGYECLDLELDVR